MAAQKTSVKRLGSGKVKIELAPTKVVAKHEDEITSILAIMGHPEALVTDESVLSDFRADGKVLDRIKRASGKAFGAHAKVVDVAEAIRKHRKGKSVEPKRRKTDERE
jgi:hypothetical protein